MPVFSQRKVDLDFELLEPKDSAIITPEANFKFTIKLRNLSDSDIHTSDTLWVYLLINGDTIYFHEVRTLATYDHMLFDNKKISDHDSITFSNIIQFPGDTLNKRMALCFSVVPHHGNDLTDAQLNNNRWCSTIITGQQPVALPAALNTPHLRIYPNPAGETFTIEGIDEIEMLQLLDCKGHLVQTLVHPSNKIDCSLYENGMYFLRIQTGASVLISKIILQH